MKKEELTWAGVVSIYERWFLHKILGPKIFGVVVQLASLVTRIVVQTLTRWLRGTRYVTRHQMVNMQWFKYVVNKSKSAFWVDSVAARFSSCPQQSTKKHNKITYAQNCHLFKLCNVAYSQCNELGKDSDGSSLEWVKPLTQCCQVSDNQGGEQANCRLFCFTNAGITVVIFTSPAVWRRGVCKYDLKDENKK